jgi:urea transporter
MTDRIRTIYPGFISSVLNSYAQVFFSNNLVFALILIGVTFFDLYAGIAGLISVILSNISAYLMGFNRQYIKAGYYGFNSLLVGLGLGAFYQPNPEFFLVLLFSAIFTLFLTVMFEGVIGKYGLPFLSMPFLLSIWLVTLATRSFGSLQLSEVGIFALNEMYGFGGPVMVQLYNWFADMNLPRPFEIYFRSLGAIFFQYHLFPGILIAVGLLIYSRLAFTLTLLGFFSAYYFYLMVGANFDELNYSYIGFNFILTAIAVGGFFVIPSKYSFLWVVLLTPLISIIITSTSVLFSIFQLSIYSLPFNFVVLLFLYILKFREESYHKPELVIVQKFSPEKNLYNRLNYKERFHDAALVSLSLPFWGEWKVTQGYEGPITHRGEWKHALDFEIVDENGLTFKGAGNDLKDYYCYDKPVIAPADGWVEEILDGVEDNAVGEVNLKQNWGNTIIIKHTEKLFTKISHLKEGSFKVKKGDHVKKGDPLAAVGNSGRSPKPHIHFQVQKNPFVGSKTMHFPFAFYLERNNGSKHDLKTYDVPLQEMRVSNIKPKESLKKAFSFVPGRILKFSVKDFFGKTDLIEEWEIRSDIYNNTFFYCLRTGSKAYFNQEDGIHYFTYFEGNKRSLLYYFYLAAYKVIFGYYKDIQIHDLLPLNAVPAGWRGWIQDITAPFLKLISPVYQMSYISFEDDFENTSALLGSKVKLYFRKVLKKEMSFEIQIDESTIQTLTVKMKNQVLEAKSIK